jgi:hypothetical protein
MKTLHSLLGLDKSNPLIEILIDPATPEHLLVHFGMHLLETVKRGGVEEQLLIARLYNAAFSRKKLREVFGYDRKTMRSWGEALKSGDFDRIQRAFSGQGALRKITPELETYIRRKYREINEECGCHSNRVIRDDLLDKFELPVSHETLRPILQDELRRIKREKSGEGKSGGTGSVSFPIVKYSDEQKSAEYIRGLLKQSVYNSMMEDKPDAERENTCGKEHRPGREISKNSKYSPSVDTENGIGFPTVGTIFKNSFFCHHAGLLLARLFIDAVTSALSGNTDIVRQWIGMVLCGCVNIEQGRKINYRSLELLIGRQKYSSDRQREELHRVASEENVSLLLRRNIVFVKADLADTYLYDPHGVEYTGQLKTLKGWLGGSHKVAKSYYQDFIHTLDGTPVFITLDDNYYDLRQRFFGNIRKFRKILGGDRNRTLTFVVDRAIYDVDFMREAVKKGVFIITWEKNYKKGQWNNDSECPVKQFFMIRRRNSAEDTVTYTVQYQRRSWDKEPSFIQFIVMLTKPGKEPVELSVICTDPARQDMDSLHPILRRWLQEIDFLYLIKLGINEITSYSSFSYLEVAEKIKDRKIKNRKHQSLCAEKLKLRKELGFELVKREEFIDEKKSFDLKSPKQLVNLNSDIRKLERSGEKEKLKALRKKRRSLKTKIRNYEKREKRFLMKNKEKQNKLRNEIKAIDGKIDEEPDTISRLEDIIENEYRKLNFMPKTFMDSIRIISRNIIYRLLKTFRPIRNNYRNDHVILRELIEATGYIEEKQGSIIISLYPSRIFPPAEKRNIVDFLMRLSYEVNRFYKTGKTIIFTLYDK